jgi:DNA repair photolyase
LIVFSGNTDCYQPIEATYGLTRACLQICAEYRNPIGIITKGALVLRDLDVLKTLQRDAWVRVYFSVAFASDEVARKVEPHAPSVAKRFEAMQTLADAGIPTGLSVAPIIPGLNDDDLPELLRRGRAAGASVAMASLLRLSGHVEDVFLERMREAFPERVGKIISRIREVRGGDLTDSRFFSRQHGSGTYWKMVEDLFELSKRRAGFKEEDDGPVPDTFRRPAAQQSLFDGEIA